MARKRQKTERLGWGTRSQAQAHPRGIADAGVGTASVCLSLEVNDRHAKAAGPQSQA